MTQDKSIIYVNGCSFTEGCDMADHMYPFFEKYYSLNEIRSEDLKVRERKQAAALKQKYKFNDTLANESLVQSIFEFERNSRWSNKLADKLGRSVYNLSSQGGTSMYAIGHRTMADLHVLQHQGYTITDIIIQVTAPGRYSFFGPTIVPGVGSLELYGASVFCEGLITTPLYKFLFVTGVLSKLLKLQ